jgi:hypothetical protein
MHLKAKTVPAAKPTPGKASRALASFSLACNITEFA